MKVLGIETSCDETAAAIVSLPLGDAKPNAPAGSGKVLGHILYTQLTDHAAFGGVVPEIAARAHLDHLDAVLRGTMAEAAIRLDELDAVAATAGPGLIGGVMIGVTTAKALSLAIGKPFIAVNHLEAHALTVRVSEPVAFPYLLLLVSGGHCQLLIVEAVGVYRRLGTTLDDALGEAFDKSAKLMGLGYPGGPAIERAAAQGDPRRYALPRPMVGRPGCDFSFSGLKTAVRLAVADLAPGDEQARCDLAASFQSAVIATLRDRTKRAAERFRDIHGAGHHLVIAGGVAANSAIRTALHDLATEQGFRFTAPPPALCTDNGVMVAWAGLEKLLLGLTDPLDFPARPRWPLDRTAAPAPFAGVKA